MVATVGSAFLGLTIGCARCHNHKFDPISQTDFYAMQAIFAGVYHCESPLPMQFSGETTLLEIAVNGVSAVKVEQKRRFGGASEPVMLNLRAGANLIVVNAVGWGADPRIAFAMAGDWTPTVAKVAPPEPTMTARTNRTKDGVFVEISASADTHWSAGPGNDFARAQQIGKMDDPVGLDLVWTAPRKAKLGPLPREWAKTEVELSFPGVRSVTGELLKVAPVTVKVQ
jgi:hypothetical protein